MNNKLHRLTISIILIILIVISLFTFLFSINRVKAQPTLVYVDDDNISGPWDGSPAYPYKNITSGIEHVDSGDTIYVFNGLYIENVHLNKSVSIIGEDQKNTIIDGNGTYFLSIIHIADADDIFICNLTVQNSASGFGVGGAGFYTWESNNVTITDCIATKCYYGFLLSNSMACRVFRNQIINNHAYGVDLRSGSSNNSIIENLVANNPTGIYFEDTSLHQNRFYRNNIINNINQVTLFGNSNFWDNGAEGNYWSDYLGLDIDGDGVGDTLLPHRGIDWFPLNESWSRERTYTVDSEIVLVTCNYTVASFEFNESQKEINYYITGPAGWKGFCYITIPIDIMKPENSSEGWFVKVGSDPSFFHRTSVDNSTIIYFEYILGASMPKNWIQIMILEGPFPVANFSFVPAMPIISELVVFEDYSIPGNGTILWCYWNFGDGTTSNTTEQIITHNYTESGNFTVDLTIFDSLGFVSSISRTIVVIQHPTADFTYLPSAPLVAEDVTFNATPSSIDDPSLKFQIYLVIVPSGSKEGVALKVTSSATRGADGR